MGRSLFSSSRQPKPENLARAVAGDDRPEGSGDNQQIHPEREILDVVEVVMELPQHVVDGGDVPLADLGPPSDAGPHDMAIAIERQFRFVPARQRYRLRPRTDPAHLPRQY